MAAAVATPALTNATSPGRVCYDRRRVALKSSLSSEEKSAEIEEALDALDKLVDRLKVMYEQYFMGIQKQAPAHLHTDAERRIREVAQLQIRNTALRYRFVTIQQKFGSYNTYWKRTVREIESGRYIRNLSKLRRQAKLTGEALPEEILAAMPKRMRESIERDRAVALAEAKRRKLVDPALVDGPRLDAALADAEPADDDDTEPTVQRFAPPPPPRRPKSVTTDPFVNAGDDDDPEAVLRYIAAAAAVSLAALSVPVELAGDPRWQATCATVRAGERAVLTAILGFVDTLRTLGARDRDAWRALAAAHAAGTSLHDRLVASYARNAAGDDREITLTT